MNTKLLTIPFQHWHWTLPPERRFIFTNENTPCVSPIENRSKGATSPWKRLTIIQICQEHWDNSSLQTRSVHGNPSNKREKDQPTAFRGKILLQLPTHSLSQPTSWKKKNIPQASVTSKLPFSCISLPIPKTSAGNSKTTSTKLVRSVNWMSWKMCKKWMS